MRIKIDFFLNNRFGIVDKTIFRLVLAGMCDTLEIANVLRIYSYEVLAISIRRLVNRQILRADIKERKLFLSDPIMALVQSCAYSGLEIELQDDLNGVFGKEGVFLSGDYVSIEEKRNILSMLLPQVDVLFLAESIDFVVNVGGDEEDGQ